MRKTILQLHCDKSILMARQIWLLITGLWPVSSSPEVITIKLSEDPSHVIVLVTQLSSALLPRRDEIEDPLMIINLYFPAMNIVTPTYQPSEGDKRGPLLPFIIISRVWVASHGSGLRVGGGRQGQVLLLSYCHPYAVHCSKLNKNSLDRGIFFLRFFYVHHGQKGNKLEGSGKLF